MNIFLDSKSENIKSELTNRGYNVVEDNNITCDAIICDLKNCDFSYINSQISLKREGALIIDSGSKSVDDIDNILSNRIFSTTF